MSKKGKKKKTRVEFRSNIEQPRRKKSWYWTHKLLENPDEVENVDTTEAVKGKGKLAKKKTVDLEIVAPLTELQRTAELQPSDQKDWKEGTVISIHGQFIKVDDGKIIRTCVLRKLLKKLLLDERNVITVGDKVDFTPIGDEEGVIERIAPRYGMLFRHYKNKDQLIVANVDQVLIVSSVDQPPLRIHLIDRYIISALVGDLTPVIVFNKIDLPHKQPLDEYERVYTALGYTVLRTSAITGEGLDKLIDVLRDKKTTLIGISGVGKSSLINAVCPNLNLRTRPVSKTTGKGVHTTTVVQLLKLDFGGYIVDTPGIRQFALSKIPRDELDRYFEEFVPFLGKCKFSNCVHIEEIDCAVKRAVEEGKIAPWRYESYVKIYTDYEEFLELWER